jgi:hypothetical protein
MDLRQVPSVSRFKVTAAGEVVGPSGRTLKHFPDERGRRRVTLYLGGRQWRQVFVHALVCEAFHGPRPSSAHVVAHGNGDHTDNRASNLRWATQEENEADKRAHGRALLGERHHQAVLTDKQVLAIRRRRAAGEPGVALAREYGVTPTTIASIHTRKTWRHL